MRKLFLLAALAAAVPVLAADVQFNKLPATSMYGTLNGFVGGTVDGEQFGDWICDDYHHTTYVPSGTWHYDMYKMSDLSGARFSGIDKYKRAAILLAGDGDTLEGALNAAPGAEISDYQYALWHLFSSDVPLPSANASSIFAKVQAADLSSDKFARTFAGLRVWTPRQDSASNQEFLQLTSVPEPGTVVLLGAGIGLIAAARLRRRLS